MTKKTAEIDMKKIDPEQVGETAEAALSSYCPPEVTGTWLRGRC
jgi:hypothetical protein